MNLKESIKPRDNRTLLTLSFLFVSWYFSGMVLLIIFKNDFFSISNFFICLISGTILAYLLGYITASLFKSKISRIIIAIIFTLIGIGLFARLFIGPMNT